jgi:chromosome segregation ATPase
MSNPDSTSKTTNATATRNNGKVKVERLAEALSGIIGKNITTESLEASLVDSIGAIGSRLRSVETESDDHESRLNRLETSIRFLQPKPEAIKREDEDFEILHHVAEVKSTIEKSGLRGMNPDAADAIWRSVDSIQQLIDPVVAVAAA